MIFITARHWDDLDLLQRADGVMQTKQSRADVQMAGWLHGRRGYPNPFGAVRRFFLERTLAHLDFDSASLTSASSSSTVLVINTSPL